MSGEFGRATLEIARKEIRQQFRTKRLWIIVPIFVAVMMLVTVVFATRVVNENDISGGFETGVAKENQAMLLFFSGFFVLSGYFYLQLLPLVLTSDAVSAEWESRTLFLLLSKPVPRGALVLGKFLASTVTVVGLSALLLVVDYLIVDFRIPGTPNGASVAGAFGAMVIVLLGCMAFAAVGVFFSTLVRSTATGIMLGLAAWIFIFPLIGSIDTIIALTNDGVSALANTDHTPWSIYLSPSSSMRVASKVLAPANSEGIGGLVARIFGFSSEGDPWIASLALVGHTALFLGLSLWIVRRRNFE